MKTQTKTILLYVWYAIIVIAALAMITTVMVIEATPIIKILSIIACITAIVLIAIDTCSRYYSKRAIEMAQVIAEQLLEQSDTEFQQAKESVKFYKVSPITENEFRYKTRCKNEDIDEYIANTIPIGGEVYVAVHDKLCDNFTIENDIFEG